MSGSILLASLETSSSLVWRAETQERSRNLPIVSHAAPLFKFNVFQFMGPPLSFFFSFLASLCSLSLGPRTRASCIIESLTGPCVPFVKLLPNKTLRGKQAFAAQRPRLPYPQLTIRRIVFFGFSSPEQSAPQIPFPNPVTIVPTHAVTTITTTTTTTTAGNDP